MMTCTSRTTNKDITTRTTNKEIEQEHKKSSGRKTYRATLVTTVKKYCRVKQSVYTSTPSQTVHLLTLPALPLLTIASNAAPLRRFLRDMPLRIETFFAPPPTIFIPFSFTLPHDIHFKVSRIENGIDIKTHSLIVARRPRAAAIRSFEF
jgi:hypothetical protein